MDTQQYSAEERLMGALAHGSIIVMGMGVVGSILIYLNQKEKSAFAAGQALQATIYHLAGMLLIMIGWGCWTGFYMLSLVPLMTNPEQFNDAPPPIFWAGLISMVCPFILMAVWWLYGVYAAIRVWMGDNFQYPFIGRFVAQQFGK